MIFTDLIAQWQLPEPNRYLYATLVALGAFVLMFGLIPVLQSLPPRGRRAVVVSVTFLAGLFFAAEFFLPVKGAGEILFPHPDENKNFLTDALQPAQNVLQIIGALALGLGTYGLVRLHLRNVVQKRAQWGYSVVLLASFVVMAVLSIAKSMMERQLLQENGTIKQGFTLLFDFTLVQLDAAMFSLIAFYIFSAAYRAFRIRSVEASILMFTAMVVMIGVVPLGAYISYQLLGLPAEPAPEGASFLTQVLHNIGLPKIANWLLTQLNAPAQRAIEFGVGIGGLAMAIRLWLSLERGVT
ncbi:MAG: hypothetical protein KatS3mg019_2457 [Fimbriimonadales bacterium]|nr:MAG: hypothetical protein KatS3mg019_2457 [Fimbriimonadales bacterium]